MQAVWQFLLDTHPDSTFDREGFWTTADEQASGDTWIAPLSQYGFVDVAGPDASKFLQGQTSCDWRRITRETASPGSYCNIKGRALSTFLATMTDETTATLRMRADIVASFCDTLAKYIVFSKAKMRDSGDTRVALGIVGERARDTVRAAFGAAPEGQHAALSTADATLIQVDATGQQFECWLAAQSLDHIWPQLSALAPLVGSRHWQRRNIQQGSADVSAATQDRFLPQQLDLHTNGGVSFKKGCYTGQEVIARMAYRGKLKKSLHRALLAGSQILPAAGEKIIMRDSGQTVGEIVNLAADTDGIALLAVISLDAAGSGAPLIVESQPDSPLQNLRATQNTEV